MPGRKKVPSDVELAVLTKSRRRCCVCFGLDHDSAEKRGQLAHLDGNPANNKEDNLAFLCLKHHDCYDSTTSQSKGVTINEVKWYREILYQFLDSMSLQVLSVVDGDLSDLLETMLDRANAWFNEVVALIAQAGSIKDDDEFRAITYEYGHSRKYVGDLLSISKVLSSNSQLEELVEELNTFIYLLTGGWASDGHLGFP